MKKNSVALALLALVFNPVLALQPSLEDRLFDTEAQLETLKARVQATEDLAGQKKANTFNPSISVIGDIVAQFGLGVPHHDHGHKHDHDHDHAGHDHPREFANGLFVREVEFEFTADVSSDLDMNATFALAQHSINDVHVHAEEAWVRYTGWPVHIKAGLFKTAFGRANRIHAHNLPWVTLPLASQVFLGEEGFNSQGLSFTASHAFSDRSALTLFLEGVMGKNVPLQEEGAEKMPNALAHAWWHQELAPAHFLDFGASTLLGRQGKKKSGAFWLFGGDIHYSYIPTGYGQDPIFLFGLESFFAKPANKKLMPGGFTWAQTRLIGSSFLGLRYDLAPKKEEKDPYQHALGAYLSYYATEFLRLRVGYEHVMPSMQTFKGEEHFFASVMFVGGAHPVEPYFANR